MAVWAGLGQAATVAQLVGADVGGLISMIMQAALTARQNKKECELLARRVFMIAELLPHLQDPEVMQRPEVRRPLTGLGDTLREAHELVSSCQVRSAAYRFVMAGRQADRFRDVQSRIDSCLFIFPVISHIGITRRLDRIYNILLPNGTSVPPSSGSQLPQLESAEVAQEVPHGAELFTLAQIAAATNNFALDSKIGSGGFSTVYKGRLHDGREVAIKPFKDRLCPEEFRSELAILSALRHKHIVRLFGWCVEEQGLLVYEYSENGTLDDHLHGQSSSPVTTSWKMRIEVLLGVSRAIRHLHCHAMPSVIHCDIKPANILLDASWVPHLSDFGASITWPKTGEEHLECPVNGTYGYADPEYVRTGFLKPASDLYSFGVVMLEVLTGKKAMRYSQSDLVSFTLPSIEAGELRKVLDRRLVRSRHRRLVLEPTAPHLKALELVARTAARCVRLQWKDRPAISDVVANLKTALELICMDGSPI